MAELEELLKLHQRILMQCWQVQSRVRSASALRSHGFALAAVARRLQGLLDRHATSLPAPLRQHTIRALAQTRTVAEALGVVNPESTSHSGNPRPSSPSSPSTH